MKGFGEEILRKKFKNGQRTEHVHYMYGLLESSVQLSQVIVVFLFVCRKCLSLQDMF